MKKISIGICCYNEEKNVENMYHAVTEQMQSLSAYDYEIIFEDNASKDSTASILRRIASDDLHVKVVFHQANYGVEKSSYNCMKRASGDAFIGIPCDFEEPPEMISKFVKYWEQGYDAVLGQKTTSEEKGITYFLREVYYQIIDSLSDYKQLDQVTGFGLYDRKVVDTILSVKKADPYIYNRHLIAEFGYNVKLVPYGQKKRKNGKSSYSLQSYLTFAINSLCGTSTKPLRIVTLTGILGTILCIVVIALRILKGTFKPEYNKKCFTTKWYISIVASIQTFFIGLLGEYIAVILRKVTQKPAVIEKETINFDTDKTNE